MPSLNYSIKLPDILLNDYAFKSNKILTIELNVGRKGYLHSNLQKRCFCSYFYSIHGFSIQF